MMDAPSFDSITPEEVEEARDAGIGIMSDGAPAARQAYHRELCQVLINMVTLEMAGLSRRDREKVSADQLSKVFAIMLGTPIYVLEARLAKLATDKTELVALAMRDATFKLQKDGNGGVRVVSKENLAGPVAGASYVTAEEFDRMDVGGA